MKSSILFLDQQTWRAGAQRVLEETLDALRNDFIPLVAFPDDGPFSLELRQRGVETLTYPLGRYRPGEKSMGEKLEFGARTLACTLALARVILQKKIRLVYINGPRALPAGVVAARLTGRPALFHLHRTLTRQSEVFIAAHTAALATRVISCSRASADALLAAEPNLAAVTQVVYNPARPVTASERQAAAVSPVPPEFQASRGPFVGFVGRLTPGKGLHVLVEAAELLRPRWPHLQMVIVGSPDPASPEDRAYVGSLKSRIVESGLESNVQWAGYHSDLGPYYARLDALALPSTDSGDGVPMVALEAAQWGVPIIASRAGGIPEVVCDGVNGLLVPPADGRALAEGLARVMGDPEFRTRMKSRARDGLDDRFSPEVFRREIREVVARLMNGPRAVVDEANKRQVVANT